MLIQMTGYIPQVAFYYTRGLLRDKGGFSLTFLRVLGHGEPVYLFVPNKLKYKFINVAYAYVLYSK